MPAGACGWHGMQGENKELRDDLRRRLLTERLTGQAELTDLRHHLTTGDKIAAVSSEAGVAAGHVPCVTLAPFVLQDYGKCSSVHFPVTPLVLMTGYYALKGHESQAEDRMESRSWTEGREHEKGVRRR